MPERPDTSEIIERLAAAGGRRTATRQAVVEALVQSTDHVTADEVARRVRKRFPSVNLSTIYRTLETLEEIGVVDHVHLGHGRAVYHLTEESHQHLVCDMCESVEELPARKLGAFARMLERDYGFEIDRRHFAIVGTCRRCLDQAGGKSAT